MFKTLIEKLNIPESTNNKKKASSVNSDYINDLDNCNDIAKPQPVGPPSSLSRAMLYDNESISEFEDSIVSDVAGTVSKEELFLRYQRARTFARRYKTRYLELSEYYKKIESENKKLSSTLSDSQDKQIRRIGELKDQIELDKRSKMDVEENYRLMMEEQSEVINVLKLQVKLLKEGKDLPPELEKKIRENFEREVLIEKKKFEEIDELKRMLSQRENLLQRCKDKINSLNSELSELKMKLSNVTDNSVCSTTISLQDNDEGHNHDNMYYLGRLKEEHAEKIKELNMKYEEKIALNNDFMQQKLDNKEEEFYVKEKTWGEKIKILCEENQNLTKMLSELKTNVVDVSKTDEVDNREEMKEKLEDKKDEIKGKHEEELMEKIDIFKEELDKLKNANEKATKENIRLSEINEELTVNNEEKSKFLEDELKKSEFLEKELQKSKVAEEELIEQMKRVNEKWIEEENQLTSKIEEQSSIFNRENEENRKWREEMESKLKEESEKLEREIESVKNLEREVESLQEINEKSAKEKNELCKEKEELMAKVNEKSTILEKETDKLIYFESELQKAKVAEKELIEQMKMIKENLIEQQKMEERCSDFEKEVERNRNLKEEIDQYGDTVKNLERNLKEESEKLEQEISRVKSLEKDVEELQTIVEILTKEKEQLVEEKEQLIVNNNENLILWKKELEKACLVEEELKEQVRQINEKWKQEQNQLQKKMEDHLTIFEGEMEEKRQIKEEVNRYCNAAKDFEQRLLEKSENLKREVEEKTILMTAIVDMTETNEELKKEIMMKNDHESWGRIIDEECEGMNNVPDKTQPENRFWEMKYLWLDEDFWILLDKYKSLGKKTMTTASEVCLNNLTSEDGDVSLSCDRRGNIEKEAEELSETSRSTLEQERNGRRKRLNEIDEEIQNEMKKCIENQKKERLCWQEMENDHKTMETIIIDLKKFLTKFDEDKEKVDNEDNDNGMISEQLSLVLEKVKTVLITLKDELEHKTISLTQVESQCVAWCENIPENESLVSVTLSPLFSIGSSSLMSYPWNQVESKIEELLTRFRVELSSKEELIQHSRAEAESLDAKLENRNTLIVQLVKQLISIFHINEVHISHINDIVQNKSILRKTVMKSLKNYVKQSEHNTEELNEMRSKLLERDGELKTMLELNNTIQSELDELKRTVETDRDRLRSTAEELESSMRRLNEVADEKGRIDEEKQSLRKELRQLNEKINDLKREFEQQTLEKQRLETQFDESLGKVKANHSALEVMYKNELETRQNLHEHERNLLVEQIARHNDQSSYDVKLSQSERKLEEVLLQSEQLLELNYRYKTLLDQSKLETGKISDQYQQLEHEHCQLKCRWDEIDLERTKLGEINNRLETEMVELVGERDSLKQKVCEFQGIIDEKEAQCACDDLERMKLGKVSDRLKLEMAALETKHKQEVDDLQKIIDGKEAQCACDDLERTKLGEVNNRLETEMVGLVGERDSLKQKVCEFQKIIDEKEAQCACDDLERIKLVKVNDRLKLEMAALETKHNSLKQEVDDLQKIIDEKEAQCSTLKDIEFERTKLLELNNQFEKEIAELRKGCDSLKENVKNMQQVIDKSQAQCGMLNEELEQTKQTNDDGLMKWKQLQNDHTKTLETNRNLIDKCRQNEELIKERQKFADELQRQLERIRLQFSSVSDEKKEVEQQMANLQSTTNLLITENGEYQGLISTYTSQLKDLNLEVEQLKTRNEIEKDEFEQRLSEDKSNLEDDYCMKIKKLSKEFNDKMMEKERDFQKTFEEALNNARKEEGRTKFDLRATIEDQNKSIIDLQMERNQLLDCIMENDSTIKKLNNSLDKKENDLQCALENMGKLQSTITELEKDQKEQKTTKVSQINQTTDCSTFYEEPFVESVVIKENEVLLMHCVDIEGQLKQLQKENRNLRKLTQSMDIEDQNLSGQYNQKDEERKRERVEDDEQGQDKVMKAIRASQQLSSYSSPSSFPTYYDSSRDAMMKTMTPSPSTTAKVLCHECRTVLKGTFFGQSELVGSDSVRAAIGVGVNIIRSPNMSSSDCTFCPVPITEATDYEYLHDVLLKYMTGLETEILAKVVCTVMKFSAEETNRVLSFEVDRNKFIRRIL